MEVALQQYVFFPTGSEFSRPARCESSKFADTPEDRQATAGHAAEELEVFKVPELPLLSFQYNPLHDLEALFWIAVNLVFGRELIDPTSGPCGYDDEQQEYVKSLTNNADARMNSLQTEAKLVLESKRLHPHLLPAFHELCRIREDLVQAYRAAELDRSALATASRMTISESEAEPTPYEYDLHDAFEKRFLNIARMIDSRVTIRSFGHDSSESHQPSWKPATKNAPKRTYSEFAEDPLERILAKKSRKR